MTTISALSANDDEVPIGNGLSVSIAELPFMSSRNRAAPASVFGTELPVRDVTLMVSIEGQSGPLANDRWLGLCTPSMIRVIAPAAPSRLLRAHNQI